MSAIWARIASVLVVGFFSGGCWARCSAKSLPSRRTSLY
jgi:hypothetical protein